MIIRKLFKYEMSHRVYDAYTRRCSENIHGHSYKLELLFSGWQPDKAQMVMDFGFVKKYFHPFVDAFDHAHMCWDRVEMAKEVDYVFSNNNRHIIAPFSSTAEMQAKMFFTYSQKAVSLLKKMGYIDHSVWTYAAIVHETDTGYAQYSNEDVKNLDGFPIVKLVDIEFSNGCIKDWSDEYKAFYDKLLDREELNDDI